MVKRAESSGGLRTTPKRRVRAGAGPGAGRGFRLSGTSRGRLRNGGSGAWAGGLALLPRAHLGLLMMALSGLP